MRPSPIVPLLLGLTRSSRIVLSLRHVPCWVHFLPESCVGGLAPTESRGDGR
jgi:hypothetical protein